MKEILVVGYDDSDDSKAALRWATWYASGDSAELVMVYVMSSVGEWELAAAQIDPDPIRSEVERLLRDEWSTRVRDAGVECRTRVGVGRPADTLMAVAREERATLIVVGMSTHGVVADLVFQSAASELTHEAQRPVVCVPPNWSPPDRP